MAANLHRRGRPNPQHDRVCPPGRGRPGGSRFGAPGGRRWHAHAAPPGPPPAARAQAGPDETRAARTRVPKTAAAAAAAAAAMRATRVVEPRPLAPSATRIDVPGTTKRVQPHVRGTQDGADEAGVRGMVAVAHLPAARKTALHRLLMRGDGGQRARHKNRSADGSHGMRTPAPHSTLRARPGPSWVVRRQEVCPADMAGAHLHWLIE